MSTLDTCLTCTVLVASDGHNNCICSLSWQDPPAHHYLLDDLPGLFSLATQWMDTTTLLLGWFHYWSCCPAVHQRETEGVLPSYGAHFHLYHIGVEYLVKLLVVEHRTY